MTSAQDLETIRAIVRAGSDYAAIKRLLGGTSWEIDEDEVDFGYVRLYIPDAQDGCHRLVIGYRDPDHPPYCFLTFTLFPAAEEHLPAFNAAFQSAAQTLISYFGAPATGGERQLSFRTWPYAYHRWSLPEGEFTLVQDEFDIRDGLDVTLWMQPVGTPLEETLCHGLVNNLT